MCIRDRVSTVYPGGVYRLEIFIFVAFCGRIDIVSEGAAAQASTEGNKAVSYTHLDVYKRQAVLR